MRRKYVHFRCPSGPLGRKDQIQLRPERSRLARGRPVPRHRHDDDHPTSTSPLPGMAVRHGSSLQERILTLTHDRLRCSFRAGPASRQRSADRALLRSGQLRQHHLSRVCPGLTDPRRLRTPRRPTWRGSASSTTVNSTPAQHIIPASRCWRWSGLGRHPHPAIILQHHQHSPTRERGC